MLRALRDYVSQYADWRGHRRSTGWEPAGWDTDGSTGWGPAGWRNVKNVGNVAGVPGWC